MQKTKNKKIYFTTKKITRLALFCAFALIMSMLEFMLPPLIAVVPNVKMGLSNAVTLCALIMLGTVDAFIVQLSRCVLNGLLFSGLSALMYSIPAGVASLFFMVILYKLVFPKISLMGISFVAATIHNITQVFLAVFYLNTPQLLLALPYYMLAGVGTGLFVGIVAFYTVKYLPKRVYLN